MENVEEVHLPNEALRLYFSEVKALHQEPEFEVEHVLMNEVEQATDFLQKAGLSDLTKIYNQGIEISDSDVNESVRQRHLTEKQANTVKSRVKTLNRTLRNRQPSRKQRQDVRDVTWNLETSSTGTRSRSATPDSLDSIPALNEESASDEDQHISLPSYNVDDQNVMFKTKLKWSTSEPLQNRVLNKHDRGDVAHLGSKNVVLMGYHPLSESTIKNKLTGDVKHTSTIVINNINNNSSYIDTAQSLENIATVVPNESTIIAPNNPSSDNEILSFEGLVKNNDDIIDVLNRIDLVDGSVRIDDISDSDYQYLKPILWLEVTTFFDQHKISIVKRKANNNKYKKGNVFGVKLTTLVMRDLQTPDNMIVPQVYQTLMHSLMKNVREEGILRIACHRQRLENLCNELETNFYAKPAQAKLAISEATPHELTGVLKKLLRELPNPIFTMELIDMFYKTHLIKDIEDKIRVLNLLVLLMPVEHRNTFRLLEEFFIDIVKNENVNRMGRHNVGMIITPSFFPPKLFVSNEVNKLDKCNKSGAAARMTREVNLAATCCNIMEIMLCAGDQLFLVPGELFSQALEAKKRAYNRKINHQDKGENRARILKKKLQRSSTQYEPGATLSPRIKRDFLYSN